MAVCRIFTVTMWDLSCGICGGWVCFLFVFFFFLFLACGVLDGACMIYFLDQGSNPVLLDWELRVLTTRPPGKCPN